MSSRGLAPLADPRFRLLILGGLASNVGDAFYAVALPWYVLAHHGGALALGEVLLAYGAARTASLIVGGHLSDRIAPWTAMMGADLTRAVAVGALAVVALLGPSRLGLLVPVAVVAGAGEGVFLPGSRTIVPALLDDDRLQAGTALASGAIQIATLVGPAVGGLVVALVGPSPAFCLDAATFVVSAAALQRIRTAAPGPVCVEPAAAAPRPGAATTLREIIRREPVVLVVFVLNIAANLGSGGSSEVALPALAHGPLHAGATGYGALVSSVGAGALLGVAVAAQIRRLRRPAVVATIAFLLEAVFLAVVPYLGGTIPAAAALLAYGSLNGFANVLTATAMQRWAPPALRGRITGFTMLGGYGIFPVSVALAGVVVRADGPGIVFPLSAAVLALALVGALTQRSWRELGAEPAASARQAAPRRV